MNSTDEVRLDVEDALYQLTIARPAKPYAFLADYFRNIAKVCKMPKQFNPFSEGNEKSIISQPRSGPRVVATKEHFVATRMDRHIWAMRMRASPRTLWRGQ